MADLACFPLVISNVAFLASDIILFPSFRQNSDTNNKTHLNLKYPKYVKEIDPRRRELKI